MTSSTIRSVVILGAIAIIGIIGIQTYWVLRSWDLKEAEFERSVYIALQRVARDLAAMNGNSLPQKDLIVQRSTNTYAVNINSEIDASSLQYYLQKELESLYLKTDFEYGIHDCASDKMVYGQYIGYNADDKKPAIVDDLPKYDEFIYYFVVRFPNRLSHIVGDMSIALILSAILLITIFFFGYSLFVILRQQRLSEMQKDFINNMTHEFKTPISTIKISSDVFLNNEEIKKDKRLYHYATIIKEQNARLNRQVEKVLNLAKVEKDHLELNLEEVNIHDILQNTVENNLLQIKEKNGELFTNFTSSHPIIKADRLHLTNILDNLIDNAVKYCKKLPEITLTTIDKDGRIEFSIADKGIGIAEEHQAKIFDKFYRVPTGNVHNVKGFGLGLFYIKNICDAHGWKLNLISSPEVGTTIKIGMNTIPIKQ